MDAAEIRKNRLDLEYKFESQKAILFLTIGTITLIGFVGYMISQKLYTLATVIGANIFILSFLSYHKTKSKMNYILRNIEQINDTPFSNKKYR